MEAGSHLLDVALIIGPVPPLEEHQGFRAEGDGCPQHIDPGSQSGQQVQGDDAQVLDIGEPEFLHHLLVTSLDFQRLFTPHVGLFSHYRHQLGVSWCPCV